MIAIETRFPQQLPEVEADANQVESACAVLNVRFGSLADITARSRHVRFTPDCVAKLTDGAR
jgi:hypothetical protein